MRAPLAVSDWRFLQLHTFKFTTSDSSADRALILRSLPPPAGCVLASTIATAANIVRSQNGQHRLPLAGSATSFFSTASFAVPRHASKFSSQRTESCCSLSRNQSGIFSALLTMKVMTAFLTVLVVRNPCFDLSGTGFRGPK